METIQINLEAHKRDHWTDQELNNVSLLRDFIQNLMNDHDFEGVRKKFGNPHYKQHNRNIQDGLENLIQYVGAFVKRFPDYAYDVKHMYADGDRVIFHSHVTTKAKDRGNDKMGLNITDTWKVEDGNIVEHWDSIQPINGFMRFFIWMTGGKIANTNGVF